MHTPKPLPVAVCLFRHAHGPHDWWYTSSDGGHMLYDDFVPDKGTWDTMYKHVKQWHCEGRMEVVVDVSETYEEVYVVSGGGAGFLDWDDRGAMSTGYHIWTTLAKARKYPSRANAIRVAQDVKRIEKFSISVHPVTLVLGSGEPVTLPEDDPEWAEYKRLQEKFKGRS